LKDYIHDATENLDLRPSQSPGIGRSNLAPISNNLSFGLVLWRIAVDFETNFADFGTFNSWKRLWTCQNVRNLAERCNKSLWKEPKTQVNRDDDSIAPITGAFASFL